MIDCTRCNNKGYTYDTEGKPMPCCCRKQSEWDVYVKPIKGLIPTSNKKMKKPSKIVNCNQVITCTVENIAGLLSVMLNDWFPSDYVITSLEELNAIGFEKHHAFKSIHEFASNYSYFIVDITIINAIRAKKPGWNENDVMCLLDLVKAIIPTPQKIVIVIRSISELLRYFPDLCSGLNDFGIEYFHTGKYKRIPKNNSEEGDGNE